MNVNGDVTVGGSIVVSPSASASASLVVTGTTTIGDRDANLVDMGIGGTLTANALLFAGDKGFVRSKDITVNSSVTIPNGNRAGIVLYDGGNMRVDGDVTVGGDKGGTISMANGSSSASLTVTGTTTIGNNLANAMVSLGRQGSVTTNALRFAGIGGVVAAKDITVNSSVIVPTGANAAITSFDGGNIRVNGDLTVGGDAGGRVYMSSGSGSLTVTGTTTIGSKDVYMVDMGLGGSFTTDSLLFAGTLGWVRSKDITVNSSVTIPNNPNAQIILGDGGTMSVNGDLTVEGKITTGTTSGSASLIVTGDCTVENTANATIKLGRDYVNGNGFLSVGGDFTYSASSGALTTRTLEFTGCASTQNINIEKAITVYTLRQVGGECAPTSYGGTRTANLTFTVYDQQCNPIALAGNAAQTGWASNFNNINNSNKKNINWTSINGTIGRIHVNCNPTIDTTGSLSTFLTCEGSASAVQSFTVAGRELINPITVGPLAGYEFSTAEASGYQSSLSFAPDLASLVAETTVYVRLHGNTAAVYAADSVPVRSSGAASKNMPIGTGTVEAHPTLTIAGGAQFQGVCPGTAIDPIHFTAGGSATGMNITWNPIISGITLSGSGTDQTLSGTPSGTSSYTLTTTGGTCAAATISGMVILKAPSFYLPASLSLGYSWNEGLGTPDEQSFDISTDCFTCDITLALSGADADKFELLTTELPKEGGTVDLRFKGGQEVGTYTDVAVTATAVAPCNTTAIIPLTGTVTATPRDFYYTGTGDWTTTANWYKSCGNTNADNMWNTVPNKYDNVTLCAAADVTITTDLIREGRLSIANDKSANQNPAKLTINAVLEIPYNWAVDAGQITVAPTGNLNVIGDFTFKHNGNHEWDANVKPIFIDNQGTINISDGKFQMDGVANGDQFNLTAYFNNAGIVNLTNSDFIITNGFGAFFYNEGPSGVVFVNNAQGSTKKVDIQALIGSDAACEGIYRNAGKYCPSQAGKQNVDYGTGTACNLTTHMLSDQALGTDKIEGGANSRVFLNAGSIFMVINSDMSIITNNSAYTNTIGGEISVQDGDFSVKSSQGDGRFRLLPEAKLYVSGDDPKGQLLVGNAGEGTQVFVGDNAQLFVRSYATTYGGDCNGLNFEEGSVGFIGDITEIETDLKLNVLEGSTLYYCGNKNIGVGSDVGYIYGKAKLYYTSENYENPEPTPITFVGGDQDFELREGAIANLVRPMWETMEQCQDAFAQIVEGGDISLLPISLVEFTAELKGSAVILGWSTLTETNNDYFTLQRSADGVAFHGIEEILGAGTTVMPQYYSYVDENPIKGISYYRLQQTDFEGLYSHSPVLSVFVPNSDAKAFEISKTTTGGITRFHCSFADVASSNSVGIRALTGTLLFETTVAPGIATLMIELPLPSGVYLVSNVNKGVKTVVKVLVTN